MCCFGESPSTRLSHFGCRDVEQLPKRRRTSTEACDCCLLGYGSPNPGNYWSLEASKWIASEAEGLGVSDTLIERSRLVPVSFRIRIGPYQTHHCCSVAYAFGGGADGITAPHLALDRSTFETAGTQIVHFTVSRSSVLELNSGFVAGGTGKKKCASASCQNTAF